jgi:hypothetical protein
MRRRDSTGVHRPDIERDSARDQHVAQQTNASISPNAARYFRALLSLSRLRSVFSPSR